jgi:chromosome partitioning protein
MKTIALANMKGGVGKTSISVSLAAELSKQSRTLLLDFDPQANTTAWTAPDNAAMKAELADVLEKKAQANEAVIPTDTPNLDLLPTFGIAGNLKRYVENNGELYINSAVKALKADISHIGYSYCVIDLSPAFGKLERAAIIEADEVITPILADRFSMDGLQAIATNLTELQGLVDKPIAQYKRIIINGLDGRIKRHADITAKVKAEMPQTIYTLPIDQVFFRAQTASRTIQALDAKNETLTEIARLAHDLEETAQ